jgi:hypothetical protein
VVGAFEVVLLILGLTTRGKARSRRTGSRSARISPSASRAARARWSGGKDRLSDELAAHDPQRPDKAQPVRIGVGVQGGLVHQRADGVVDQQVGLHLLLDALGGLGAQHRPGAALVGLALVQRTLQLPALVVGGGQFLGGAWAGSSIAVTSR